MCSSARGRCESQPPMSVSPDMGAASPEDDHVKDTVKVRFALDRDDSGWPPAESEGLWAQPVGSGRFRLDNTPWFVRGVAADDVVEAEPDDAGVLWFVRLLERGERVVVRVIPRRDGPLNGDRQAVVDAFAPLGVSGEGMATPVNMVALDIGPEAPLASIKALLERGEADGGGTTRRGASPSSGLASPDRRNALSCRRE
jgi:hypothetical protein